MSSAVEPGNRLSRAVEILCCAEVLARFLEQDGDISGAGAEVVPGADDQPFGDDTLNRPDA